jgi:hypothetical protein
LRHLPRSGTVLGRRALHLHPELRRHPLRRRWLRQLVRV